MKWTYKKKKNHKGWLWESSWGVKELEVSERNNEAWAWGPMVTSVGEWEWVGGWGQRKRYERRVSVRIGYKYVCVWGFW